MGDTRGNGILYRLLFLNLGVRNILGDGGELVGSGRVWLVGGLGGQIGLILGLHLGLCGIDGFAGALGGRIVGKGRCQRGGRQNGEDSVLEKHIEYVESAWGRSSN